MLAILAKAFVQADLALQYQNLQPATPVTSFSLLEFSAAMTQQVVTTKAALSALGAHQAAITRPIDYEIPNVDRARLTDGQIYSFTIYPDAKEFLPMSTPAWCRSSLPWMESNPRPVAHTR